MTSNENSVVEFFSSVRFSFLIISLIVMTSIIGTILPQGQPLGFYAERYGHENAIILEILGLSSTYSSLWFKSLLLILCLNLVVCTLNRLPQVLKIIKNDNLSVDLAKLMRNKDKILFTSCASINAIETAVPKVLKLKHWKVQTRSNPGFLLFFSERSAWSRLGAYIVHGSILVIALGAFIGSAFGFKAFVLLPEGEETSEIYQRNDKQTPIPLPFKLRCDAFNIEYYDNGMPKEYRSDLVALKDGKEVVKKQITVNNPFTHSGLTFYQSSYEPMSDQYSVTIAKVITDEKNQQRTAKQSFYAEPREKYSWKDKQVEFEIVETGADGHGHGPYPVWFDDEWGEPLQLVVEDKKPLTVNRGESSYEILVKQRYATGLQVVKDPGVWLVYLGFGLMLLGLYVAFFMSHRRLWISIQKTGETVTIILSGSSNKNQAGFSNTLEEIAIGLVNEKTLELRRI